MALAQLAGVMGKAMYDMQKAQDKSFDAMHSRTRTLCHRIEAAAHRLHSALHPRWFAQKKAAAAAARSEVEELRQQEAALIGDVQRLQEQLTGHTADLKKVQRLT